MVPVFSVPSVPDYDIDVGVSAENLAHVVRHLPTFWALSGLPYETPAGGESRLSGQFADISSNDRHEKPCGREAELIPPSEPARLVVVVDVADAEQPPFVERNLLTSGVRGPLFQTQPQRIWLKIRVNLTDRMTSNAHHCRLSKQSDPTS